MTLHVINLRNLWQSLHQKGEQQCVSLSRFYYLMRVSLGTCPSAVSREQKPAQVRCLLFFCDEKHLPGGIAVVVVSHSDLSNVRVVVYAISQTRY
jgi:hypothetical protein